MRETSYEDAVLVTNSKLPTLLAPAFPPSPQKYAALEISQHHFSAIYKIRVEMRTNMNV
jgi:hypothetical protein